MKSNVEFPKLVDKTSGKNNLNKTNPWEKPRLTCIPGASKYKKYIKITSKQRF